MADSGSKTEKATPKKRKDQRKKGNTFQSRDVVSVVSILALFYILQLMFPLIYKTLTKFIYRMIGYISSADVITITLAKDITIDFVQVSLIIMGPLMLVAILIGVIASGIQTKFLISFENIKPKFSKINPLKGLQKMVSIRSLVELVKSMIKISIIAFIIYLEFAEMYKRFSKLMFKDVFESFTYIGSSIMSMVLKIVLVFAAIAAFDYFYQWWEYEKNIKMSKQEVKEEYKQMEGDPQVKGKIKERQRKMAMQRMMQNVPQADVIVRNPTHFAIALKYDLEKNIAPIVLAKGQDYVALKIIEVATKHNIPTTENKPLARALYASCEVGTVIPPEFYVAMAEVMAWVYKLNEKDEIPPLD